MSQLQEQFVSETKVCAINSQGEPDIEYVSWLENKVEKLTESNTRRDEIVSKVIDYFRNRDYATDSEVALLSIIEQFRPA